MKIKIIVFLVIFSVMIFGCSKEGYIVHEPSEDEKQAAEEIPVAEVKDCNDNDPCTLDSSVNGKCNYEKVIPCCGNNLCEENEGCDTMTYTTRCVADCGQRCEPKINVMSISCDGSCSVGREYLDFSGPGRAKFTLYNSGERPLEELTASLNCEELNGNTEYSGYFNDKKDRITLQSRENGYYYVAFNQPDDFELDCDVTFTSKSSVVFEHVKARSV